MQTEVCFFFVPYDHLFNSVLHADKSAASKAILEVLAAEYPSPDPTQLHPISLPHVSRLYKLLLQGGHFSQSTKSIERSALFSPFAFAKQFIELVGEQNTVAMAEEEAVFVVASLCETVVSDEEGEDAKKTLRKWLGGAVKEELSANQEQRGRKVLLEQIARLS